MNSQDSESLLVYPTVFLLRSSKTLNLARIIPKLLELIYL
jgi:hypothetical protein